MRRVAIGGVALAAGLLSTGLLSAGCGDDGPSSTISPEADTVMEAAEVMEAEEAVEAVEVDDPRSRSVVVTTRPCGDASSRVASGVIVSPGLAVTAAHVVAASREVSVSDGEVDRSADVVVLDHEADVAVLQVLDGPGIAPSGPVELTRFARGQRVRLVGGAASGTVDLVVSRPVRIDIDGRRLGERVERDGYELIGVTADGDSGAGVYDAEGRLGGLVFARSDERPDVAFAVEASEIREALERPPVSHRCDEDRSALEPDEQ